MIYPNVPDMQHRDIFWLCLRDKHSKFWEVEYVFPEEPWGFYTILKVETASVNDVSFRNRGGI